MRVLAVLTFVCLALVGSAALAQRTAAIRGTVVDPAGSAIPGATLELLQGG